MCVFSPRRLLFSGRESVLARNRARLAVLTSCGRDGAGFCCCPVPLLPSALCCPLSSLGHPHTRAPQRPSVSVAPSVTMASRLKALIDHPAGPRTGALAAFVGDCVAVCDRWSSLLGCSAFDGAVLTSAPWGAGYGTCSRQRKSVKDGTDWTALRSIVVACACLSRTFPLLYVFCVVTPGVRLSSLLLGAHDEVGLGRCRTVGNEPAR